MVFKPIPCKTRWEGLILCGWIGLIDLLLLVWGIQRPTDPVRFGLLLLIVASIPLLIHLLYRNWAIFTLEYWVDRNAVTVCWANVRQVIPLHGVQRVVQGDALAAGKAGWWHWPGPYLRPGSDGATGPLTLLATRPPERALLLDTGVTLFALSPLDEAGFLAAMQERFLLGPAVAVQTKRQHVALLSRFFG